MAEEEGDAPSAVVDIFSLLAQQQTSEAENVPDVPRDSELLFLGSKQSGKSTLINSFLMRDDAPKPTTALEYRFARRSTGANGASAVCNIWELGGGTQLSELLKVVMLADKLDSCVVAVTLDLAAAGDALSTMLLWFDQVRKQVKLALEQIAISGPGGIEKANAIRERARLPWAEHPDADSIVPIGVPVVVLAHKWDAFEAEFGEAEFKKLLTRTLRFHAHANGASLVCTRQKDKAMLGVMRNMLYHHVFDTGAVKTLQLEHLKPLVVPASADSFAGIGPPPKVEGVISDDPAERWKAAFEATFPAKAAKREAQDLSMVEAEQFAEETVDELRRTKQEELLKLRKQLEQEAKMSEAVPVP